MNNIAKDIEQIKAIEYKDISIGPKGIENNSYLSNNKLIVNSEQGNLLNELKKCLSECEKFYFSVAFINFSGLQLLLDTFKELEQKGAEGRIITSTYLNFTEPKALERIKDFSNIDLKVFIANKENGGFHTKAYIFENKEDYKIIIGSSNITQRALKSNVEWNVRVVSKKEDRFLNDVLIEYKKLWDSTEIVNEKFINKYNNFIKEIKKIDSSKKIEFENYQLIKPNEMQVKAIDNLNRLRAFGEEKALVIAATGTGKTYMSAFDVINFKPKKMLFIVHREEILISAERTFKRLVKNKQKTTGLLTGNRKDLEADYLFSTIQSMNSSLYEFREDEFEYIIVDEAHHAGSPTYKKVIEYFKPKFLLGMTATPERSDSENIFDVFNNVALEVRLREALDLDLVMPFHYFGITDIDGIDLSDVDLKNMDEVAKRLKVNKRVDFIIERLNFYGYDGEKLKSLGFCANIEHAEYMAAEFNKRGIESICLTGNNSPQEREEYIKKLESHEDSLKVIFTVDIFNEGVDIPSINSVLMLRPTNSPIVFIQQLGRGLRKHEDKSFLTVLDFIGNHNKAFLIAIALNGSRYYDKDSLKVAVATEFANIPGCTNIQMDRISQERILKQLDNENFNSMKYLKEEYLQFKRMRGGKVPYLLMDYIRYDGAPDPTKFISREKTYLGFVAKMEKDEELKKLQEDDIFFKIIKEISGKLPIKRVYEFAIIKYLMNHHEITLEQARNEILKYIEDVDDESIEHAFEYLNQNFYDSSQLKSNVKSFEYAEDTLKSTKEFLDIINNKTFRCYIEDIINYGLLRYKEEFENKYYGVPFFKLYEQYQMIDTALLSNYTKIHSSFRGSGLIANGKEYFLFIDLHKEEDIKESINYEDKLLSRKLFQWQTPNSTSQASERGKNIIFNKEREVNLHLFVRKYREIDGNVEPYIYIGKGNTIKYHGEKPITVALELENEIPASLYMEFNKKV
ncbi:DUF3427 domain-containing protein [Clostridium bovifaecis]|uniref:DUF3427 domain-containing protein n=1 Tax=Clostridium bovifaecis TaxID=2184719 RepID=A0A6I6EW90_9CLOT|nr:DUF3427 domain-containing protein [Clostridium bovifaecis]